MCSAPEEELNLYEGKIPDFVEGELDKIYGARYSTWPHFALHGSISNAHTFTMSRGETMLAVLIFLVKKNLLLVLNEGIQIDSFVIRRFAEFMFNHNPHLTAISLNAIELDQIGLSCPFYRAVCADDLVMPLPAAQDWIATLSSQYRNQVRRNIKRIKSQHPSFAFEVHEKDTVDSADIRAIIYLNKARMTVKKKKASIDDGEQENIVNFVAKRGFVGLIRIEGEVRAGVILYRLGKNFALRTLGHDAAYDQYSIGMTALFLTIERAAEQQSGGVFFFGWGEEAYKFRLGARKRVLSKLIVYRTSLAQLQNLPLTLGAVRVAVMLRMRHWLHGLRGKRQRATARPGAFPMKPI